jgi:hypothetical protein
MLLTVLHHCLPGVRRIFFKTLLVKEIYVNGGNFAAVFIISLKEILLCQKR